MAPVGWWKIKCEVLVSLPLAAAPVPQAWIIVAKNGPRERRRYTALSQRGTAHNGNPGRLFDCSHCGVVPGYLFCDTSHLPGVLRSDVASAGAYSGP
jgi:hypothetical protein